MKTLFRTFYKHFSYLELEQAVEYFSILGGIGENIELKYSDNVFSMVESNFVKDFNTFRTLVRPSYLLDNPYRALLMAAARGDGKFYSVFRKAKLSETVGSSIVKELVTLGVLSVEYSRELPLRIHSKQKLPKDQRSYRIQDKLRFRQPFMRFWFGFVEPYQENVKEGRAEKFLENFSQHYERLRTLVYEQLCNDFLIAYYKEKEPLITHGSYWNIYSEFDILAVTKNKKLILGECKYKDRMVCKNEFTKLKMKAMESNIKVDIYVLFSKSGFSKELLGLKSNRLLLFDIHDLKYII